MKTMMSKLSIATVAVAVSSLAPAREAIAADLGPYAPPPSVKDTYVPRIAEPTWRGFYVGVNGGYAWGADNGMHFNSATDGTASGLFDNSGGFGGGQLGYNAQFGAWVLGVEADVQGAGISDNRIGTTAGGFAAAVQNDINYFGTIRGRVGFAAGPMLFYGTGGFAWANMDTTAVGTTAAGRAFALSGSSTETGYVLGGGVEYAFSPNWSLKVEYQYLNLDPHTLSGLDSGGNAVAATVDQDMHTVRAGLNFRF